MRNGFSFLYAAKESGLCLECKKGIFQRKGCNILSTYAYIFSVRHLIPYIIGRTGGRILYSIAMSIVV